MYNNDHSVKRYVTENDDVLSRSNLTRVASKARLDKDPLWKVSVLTFEDATHIKNYLCPAGLFGNMDKKKRVEKGNGEIVHVDVWAAGLQLPSIADVDLGETSSSEEEEEGGVAPGFNVDKALEAQVARLSSSSSSSSIVDAAGAAGHPRRRAHGLQRARGAQPGRPRRPGSRRASRLAEGDAPPALAAARRRGGGAGRRRPYAPGAY